MFLNIEFLSLKSAMFYLKSQKLFTQLIYFRFLTSNYIFLAIEQSFRTKSFLKHQKILKEGIYEKLNFCSEIYIFLNVLLHRYV